MKLIPQAKPVRIRISCDGQEHFSLASLRKSFRCNAVSELMDAPLVKWLKQQNESEVANRVKLLIDCKEKCSPIELASAFFVEEGIDKVDSPLSLFDFWSQHGYQYNAIKFVEDCYQTYKAHPEFESLFYKYLHLDDDEQQRNVLFLLNEDIDTNLAGIPLAITFMCENGFRSEANNFIRKHQKLFANDPKLREFLLTLRKEQSAQIIQLQAQSTAAAKRTLAAQGYTIGILKKIMHNRFICLSDSELARCMHMALMAKEGYMEPIPDGFNDEPIVIHTIGFLRSVSEIIQSLKFGSYNAKDWVKKRTDFYHIYDRCIYNIMRKFLGYSIDTSDEIITWYCKIREGNDRDAIRAIRWVCDAYMLTEEEFQRRNGATPYIEEMGLSHILKELGYIHI